MTVILSSKFEFEFADIPWHSAISVPADLSTIGRRLKIPHRRERDDNASENSLDLWSSNGSLAQRVDLM